MGGFAARKSKILLDHTAQIMGVELMIASAAIDYVNLSPSKRLKEIK